MRIEELLAERQQIDELGLADVGRGLKKAASAVGQGIKSGVGAVGKAAGAVVGAIPGVAQTAGDAVGSAIGGVAGGIRRGFNQASIGQRSNFGALSQRAAQNDLEKKNQNNQNQDPNATVGAATGQQATAQGAATGQQATAQGAATGQQATAPAAQANPQAQAQNNAQADQQAKVGVGQINKIIPGLRTRDLQSIKTNIDKAIAAKAKQPAAATQQAQPQGNQTVTKANTVVTPQQQQAPAVGKYSGQPTNMATGNIAAMAESVEFYSRFLGKNI
jgi:hypothetical protein